MPCSYSIIILGITIHTNITFLKPYTHLFIPIQYIYIVRHNL